MEVLSPTPKQPEKYFTVLSKHFFLAVSAKSLIKKQ